MYTQALNSSGGVANAWTGSLITSPRPPNGGGAFLQRETMTQDQLLDMYGLEYVDFIELLEKENTNGR